MLLLTVRLRRAIKSPTVPPRRRQHPSWARAAPSRPRFAGRLMGSGLVSGYGSLRTCQGLSLSSSCPNPPLAINSHLHIIPKHVILCARHLPAGRAGTFHVLSACRSPLRKPSLPPSPTSPPPAAKLISSFTPLLHGGSPSSCSAARIGTASCRDMLFTQLQPKNLAPFPTEHTYQLPTSAGGSSVLEQHQAAAVKARGRSLPDSAHPVPVSQNKSGVSKSHSGSREHRFVRRAKAQHLCPGMDRVAWTCHLPSHTGITPPFTWVPGGKTQQRLGGLTRGRRIRGRGSLTRTERPGGLVALRE